MLVGLLRHRAFIWQRAVADLRHQYAGTGMGAAWNVAHPLIMIAVYSSVFGGLMRQSLPDDQSALAFPFYLCSGLFPWIAFSDALRRGCNAFVANANYLRKLPIPEPVFVAECAAAALLSLAISLALLLAVAAGTGRGPHWTWLLMPGPVLALMALAFSSGLLLGTLHVFFRDVGQWVNGLLPAVMWTLPVVYTTGKVTALNGVLPWHPVYAALLSVRECFYGRVPPAWALAAMLLWPLLVGALAAFVLRRLRAEIRDVI